MTLEGLTTIIVPAVVLAVGVTALALSLSGRLPTVAAASNAQNGRLHVTKECSQYSGLDGSFCTITSSNLPEIKVDSTNPANSTKVYYDQAGNTPTNGMDSNVVLYVGIGDWAVGRCTIDGSTGNGLCTFSDGIGKFAGFSARVNVTYLGGVNYAWDGTYSFNPLPGR